MRNHVRNHVATLATFSKLALGGAILSMLAACGGGGDSTDATASTSDEFVYVGSVGDGPIVNAEIFIYDANGGLMATQRSDAFANYEVTVKPGKNPFPIMLEAIRGTDLVTGLRPDFTLKAVSLSRSDTQVNLNPYSTLIVEAARAMPEGLTAANVDAATEIVLREMNFGLDTAGVPNPVTTSIDEKNIANIVRGSEALGEMIRRTRTGLTNAGFIRSHNDIVSAIARDLVDGRLDGRGAAGTDTRISAVVGTVAAQVLVEQFTNSLHVNGTLATTAMDSAINTTLPTTPANALTGSVAIPQAMISQTERLLNALQSVDARPEIAALAQTVTRIPAGSTTRAAGATLGTSQSRLLDVTITNVAQASTETIETLTGTLAGDVAAPTPVEPTEPAIPANRAPSIHGSAMTSVTAGTAYAFTPVAADADGDQLTFRIANRPVWAAFDTRTGRLSGTPGTSHIGSHGNIVISVSDGTASASLNAFSIRVVAGNATPSISGQPQTTVIATNTYSFTPSASDSNGDTLTFSIRNRPSWATFSTTTGRLYGTPSNSDVGNHGNIVITVSDGTATASLPAFGITVSQYVAPNRAPVISGSPPTTVAQGSAYSFRPTASDPDGNPLTFSVSNKPAWLNFNNGTGQLSGTPTNSDVRTYSNIIIRVSDGTATAALPAFSLTVTNVNDAPTITGSPITSVGAGAAYSFAPTAMDIDGDTLTFNVSNLPSWATFNNTTGRISGTPSESNVGTYGNIVISVSDGRATAQLVPFSITVNSTQPANRDVTLRWVAPTTRSDGSAIPLSQIAGFRIHYGTAPGNYTSTLNINDGSTTSYTVRNMTPATYHFVVTTIDANGQESAHSSAVSTQVR